MARRKVKNGAKSPLGKRLTRQVPNGRRRSEFWLVPENFCVFLPNQNSERRRPFGTCLVRHCPQGLFSPFFTFLRAIFFRPFRLSLAPTLCPSVSEDDTITAISRKVVRKSAPKGIVGGNFEYCTVPQIIPRPQMIPKMDRKSSSTASDP